MRCGGEIVRWIGLILLVMAPAARGEFDFDYFGVEPPGLERKPFQPSIGGREYREAFSIHFTPDGNECYLVLKAGDAREVVLTKKVDGAWSVPAPANLPQGATSIKGFSPDGNRLYYLVRRKPAADVYVATRTAEGWSAGQLLPGPVNNEQGIIGLSVGAHEDLYFCSWRKPGQGACDVWRAKCVDGTFPMTENLTTLNTPTSECSIVSGVHDEFVIFYSWRPGGFGQADLYVSFPVADAWTPPRNLGPRVNTADGEVPQTLSPDGKYLFFYRNGVLYWIAARAVLPTKDGAIENANSRQRFGSLQCAIDYANSGDTLLIPPGAYSETIDLAEKDVVFRAPFQNDPNLAASAVPEGSPTCRCAQ